MKIRKAAPKDAIGIAKVLKDSYNISSIEEGIDAFKNEAQKGCNFIVADDNGRITGITSWQMHGLPKHQLAELDRIAVLKEYRGKGLGKKLFQALIKEAGRFYRKNGSKLRKLYLFTHADNKKAQAFYKKLGLNHEATLKSHYCKDKDEFVFSIFFQQ